MLSTRSLEKAVEEKDQLEAVDRLVERFTFPLEGAGANPAEIHAKIRWSMHLNISHLPQWTIAVFGGISFMLLIQPSG